MSTLTKYKSSTRVAGSRSKWPRRTSHRSHCKYCQSRLNGILYSTQRVRTIPVCVAHHLDRILRTVSISAHSIRFIPLSTQITLLQSQFKMHMVPPSVFKHRRISHILRVSSPIALWMAWVLDQISDRGPSTLRTLIPPLLLSLAPSILRLQISRKGNWKPRALSTLLATWDRPTERLNCRTCPSESSC